jgi:hypothetical protein
MRGVQTTGVFILKAEDVVWGHAVNSKSLLEECLASPQIVMLEADIMLKVIPEEGPTPVMAHPPTIPPDAPRFVDWLDRIIEWNEQVSKGGSSSSSSPRLKGIKLDFKNPNCVEPCLQRLQQIAQRKTQKDSLYYEFDFPVWLNADVLKGPGGKDSPFDLHTFIGQCLRYYPKAVLSLGWTTSIYGSEAGYTSQMVDEMVQGCKKAFCSSSSFFLNASSSVDHSVVGSSSSSSSCGPVLVPHLTFPVNAFYLRDSWPQLTRLLEAFDGNIEDGSADVSGSERGSGSGVDLKIETDKSGGEEDRNGDKSGSGLVGGGSSLTIWGYITQEDLAWLQSTAVYRQSKIFIDAQSDLTGVPMEF